MPSRLRRAGSRAMVRTTPNLRLVRQHPLAKQLVGWWLAQPWLMRGFSIADLAGANTGTLRNMAMNAATSGWGSTTRRGGFAELRFDLTDDYVDCGNRASLDLTRNLTMAAWIYLYSFGGGGFGRIMDHRASGAPAGYTFIVDNVTTTGGLGFLINDGIAYGQDWAGTAAGTITTGQWYHAIVSVTSASSVTFYINGLQASQDTGSGLLNQTITSTVTSSFQLGAAFGRTDRNFHGLLDDVRLWSRALTGPEMRWVYTNSLLRWPGLLEGFPKTLPRQRKTVVQTVTPARWAWSAPTEQLKRTITVTTAKWATKAAVVQMPHVVVSSRWAWQAATRALTLMTRASQLGWKAPLSTVPRTALATTFAWQGTAAMLGRSLITLVGRTAWQAATVQMPHVILATRMGFVGSTPRQQSILMLSAGRMAWRAALVQIPHVMIASRLALQVATPMPSSRLGAVTAPMAWRATTRALTVAIRPSSIAMQTSPSLMGRLMTGTASRLAWQSATRALTLLVRASALAMASPILLLGRSACMTAGCSAWQTPSAQQGQQLVITPARMVTSALMPAQTRTAVIIPGRAALQAPSVPAVPGQLSIPAAAMACQRATGIPQSGRLLLEAARQAFQAPLGTLGRTMALSPGRMAWRAATRALTLTVRSSQMAWSAAVPLQTSGDIVRTSTPAALAWRSATSTLGWQQSILSSQVALLAAMSRMTRTLLVQATAHVMQTSRSVLGQNVMVTPTRMATQAVRTGVQRSLTTRPAQVAKSLPPPHVMRALPVSAARYRMTPSVTILAGEVVTTYLEARPAGLAWQVANVEAALRPVIVRRLVPVFRMIPMHQPAQVMTMETRQPAQVMTMETRQPSVSRGLVTCHEEVILPYG